MMCLFITVERCHVRHAFSPRKVNCAFFFSPSLLIMQPSKVGKYLANLDGRKDGQGEDEGRGVCVFVCVCVREVEKKKTKKQKQ